MHWPAALTPLPKTAEYFDSTFLIDLRHGNNPHIKGGWRNVPGGAKWLVPEGDQSENWSSATIQPCQLFFWEEIKGNYGLSQYPTFRRLAEHHSVSCLRPACSPTRVQILGSLQTGSPSLSISSGPCPACHWPSDVYVVQLVVGELPAITSLEMLYSKQLIVLIWCRGRRRMHFSLVSMIGQSQIQWAAAPPFNNTA